MSPVDIALVLSSSLAARSAQPLARLGGGPWIAHPPGQYRLVSYTAAWERVFLAVGGLSPSDPSDGQCCFVGTDQAPPRFERSRDVWLFGGFKDLDAAVFDARYKAKVSKDVVAICKNRPLAREVLMCASACVVDVVRGFRGRGRPSNSCCFALVLRS